MTNFFRKLRRENMKGAQYFKYALGEILLMVIGILIALSINNWNEGRKERKKEKLTIEILKDEIEKNLSHINEDYLSNSMILDSLTLYLKGDLTQPDDFSKAQFISYTLNYSWGKLEYPTLDQELGPNRVIRDNASLSASLKALNASHIEVDFQLNYLNELFNNQTIPYLLDAGAGTGLINTMFQNNKDVEKLAILFGTESLNNILSIQQLFLFSYNRRIQGLIEQSEQTLKILQAQ